MSEDTVKLDVRPDVAAFVAAVRARLGDLTEEEREELLGGLEADLSERVGEGEDGLGDPVAYATELRAAAGLEIRRGRRAVRPRRSARPFPEEVMSLLDECRALWDRLTSAHPWAAEAWHVAQAMRPAWWVLRAWLAVQLLDLTLGPAEYLTFLPSLGNQVAGALVLVLAVVVSVLVGTGRLRPDGPPLQAWRSRLALLVLNAFAVAIALPLVLGGFPDAWDSHRLANGAVYSQGRPETPPGLRSGGHYIRNVFAYDTEGKPLTGVQLYDQVGRPLAVSQDTYLRSYRTAGGPVRTYPWHNGDHELFNVYPLPVREEGGMRPVRDPWGTSRPPTLPSGPMAVVPPVALPTPTAAQPQVTPAPGASPVPSGRTSPSTDSEKTRPR